MVMRIKPSTSLVFYRLVDELVQCLKNWVKEQMYAIFRFCRCHCLATSSCKGKTTS